MRAVISLAGSVGFGSAVLIGKRGSKAVGIRVMSAHDFADAPRVMVPATGGCWHDHQSADPK